MDDISVDFSGEELVVLSRLARVEALRGVDTVTDGADPPSSRALLGAVERALIARRVASPGEHGPELLPVARQLIITLARPALRARVNWFQDGASTELQYAAIGPVAVELRSLQGGVYRLTPFSPEELQDRMVARLPLPERPSPDRRPFRLPRADLRQALRLGRNGDSATAGYVVTDGAVPAEAARAFAAALGPQQVTAAVEITYLAGGGNVRGGEVSWVDGGDAGLWIVPAGWQDPTMATRGAAEVTPTTTASLRHEILSYFPARPAASGSPSDPGPRAEPSDPATSSSGAGTGPRAEPSDPATSSSGASTGPQAEPDDPLTSSSGASTGGGEAEDPSRSGGNRVES